MLLCADPSFGLSHQALAILHFLAGMPPSFARYDESRGGYEVRIRTYPWYNGRETGVALVMYPKAAHVGPCLIVAFGECRNTDGIFVEHWTDSEAPFNGPTVLRREWLVERDWATTHRTSFDRGEVGKAVDYIYSVMAKFYAEHTLKLVPGGP